MKRKIKVERLHRVDNRNRGLTYGRHTEVPHIRLKGNWLREAGFEMESDVSAVVEYPGRIVIEAQR